MLNCLIVARLAVHLQPIIEKFGHDLVVSFSNATDLSDATINSQLSPLKNPASLKSSNSSLRRCRLAEITEDVGETNLQGSLSTERDPNSTSRDMTSVVEGSSIQADANDRPKQGPLALSGGKHKSSEPIKNLDKSLPATPNESLQDLAGAETSHRLPSLDIRPSSDGRPSTQSTRPSTRDIYSGHAYKPKIKQGPRPSLEYGRAPPSGSVVRSNGPRPISTLPPGISMPTRKAAVTRPSSQHNRFAPKFAESARIAPSPPPISILPPIPSERPSSRSGSIMSVSTYTQSTEAIHHPTATPEKQRLMKALQRRKRQMEKKTLEEAAPPQPPKLSEESQIMIEGDRETQLRASDDVDKAGETSDSIHVSFEDHGRTLDPTAHAPFASIPGPSDGPLTQTTPVTEVKDCSVEQPLDKADMRNVEDVCCETEAENTERPNRLIGLPDLKAVDESIVGAEENGAGNTENDDAKSAALRGSALPANVSQPGEEQVPIAQLSMLTPLPQEIPLPPTPNNEEALQEAVRDADGSVHDAQPERPQDDPSDQLSAMIVAKEPSHLAAESIQTRPSTGDSIDNDIVGQKAGPRGLFDPTNLSTNAEQSDENFLSDDSFMDEIQSATVHEAKPISVSRSPVTSVFPSLAKLLNEEKSAEALRISRIDSNPAEKDVPQDRALATPQPPTLSPTSSNRPTSPQTLSPTRAVSSPLANATFRAQHDLSPTKSSLPPIQRSVSTSPTPSGASDHGSTILPKKTGVSSLISQRIKALEKFSSPGSQQQSPTLSITPSFASSRQNSFDTPNSSSTPNTASGVKRWRNPKESSYPTPSPSPHGNIVTRTFGFKKNEPLFVSTKSRPESVSVAATMIRDPSTLDPSEPRTRNLHHSPPVVQHPSPIPPSSSPSKAQKRLSKSKASSTVSKSSTSPEGKTDNLSPSRRNSLTSRRSTSSRKGSLDVPRPLSQASSDGLSSPDGYGEEKKESRKSRLFKRMSSSISSASRRSIAHVLGPTMKEEPIMERQEPEIPRSSAVAVDVGDLNVQFPDTLVTFFQPSFQRFSIKR